MELVKYAENLRPRGVASVTLDSVRNSFLLPLQGMKANEVITHAAIMLSAQGVIALFPPGLARRQVEKGRWSPQDAGRTQAWWNEDPYRKKTERRECPK